jgi:hypothetical protein
MAADPLFRRPGGLARDRHMITLYSFGPAFSLPDPSPFVTKAEVLLKMAGLTYAVDTGGFNKAPKGKLPYIVDDGETIADPTFSWHIEKKYQFGFDRGLTRAARHRLRVRKDAGGSSLLDGGPCALY